MIVAPIELAGPWKAEVFLCGKPQMLGIHLQFFTEIVDHQEHRRNMRILLTTDYSQQWFSDGPHSSFEFEGRRLVLRVTSSKLRPWQEEFELNFEFDEAARQWSG